MSPVDYPHREESSPDRENAGGWQVVAGRRTGGGAICADWQFAACRN